MSTEPLIADPGPPPQPSLLPGYRGWIQSSGDLIARMCLWSAAIAMWVIVAICGANVALRYLIGSAWSWAEEAMLFLMIVIVFMGAATVTWNGIHLSLDMLLRRLSGKVRGLVVWTTTAIAVGVLLLCSTVSFQVVKLLYEYSQKSQALEISLWIPQGLICLGFALMAVLTVMRAILVGASLPVAEFR